MSNLLLYLLILLVTGFLGGVILKSLKQPPVVGYLLAGLLMGILVVGSVAVTTVEFLSELGIVLLLFTLGIEFSFTRLRKVAKVAVYGSIIQMLATIFISTFFITFFGFSWYASLFMAAAFSLSSTAVVVKILADKGELDTLQGEILVGWLVVQDLAVLPMIVLLPTLGKEFASGITFESIVTIVKQIGFSGLILAAVMILGKRAIPYVMKRVASLNSRELLLIGVFTIALLGAYVTQLLGLSAALGAFLAGLLIAESTQQHAVFSEIRPLRDVFALIFFTTLGLVLPQGFLFAHFGQIIWLTLLVMVVKFFIVISITLFLGYHAKTSLMVGVGLIEVGEFAFILSRVGLKERVIDTTVYGMILSVALLSIFFLPPLYFGVPAFYTRLREFSKKRMRPLYAKFFTSEHTELFEELPLANHVVLCGYGRVGKYIGRALEMAEVPYIVVEYNHHKADLLKEKGIPFVYGDPADIDILDYAQVDKARAVVITIPDFHTTQQVVTNSLTLNKDIHIYCRTHHESEQKHLKALGVTTIIQPEFEASLSIAQKILQAFGKEREDIEGKVSRLKIEHGLG